MAQHASSEFEPLANPVAEQLAARLSRDVPLGLAASLSLVAGAAQCVKSWHDRGVAVSSNGRRCLSRGAGS